MAQEEDQRAENDRIRGYLVSQAERNDISGLWPRVIGDRTAFLLALDRVTEEQARWRAPNGSGWNILEVAQHMLVWGQSVTQVIEALAVGSQADVPALGALEGSGADTLADARQALTEIAVRFASLPGRLP